MIKNEKTEIEVFGVNYERFSLGKKIGELVRKYKIKTVCELPAHGAKAAPSLYSIDFALAGARVVLVNGIKDSLMFYKELGIEKNIEIVKVEDISQTFFKDSSFDFVWNFAFIPTYKNQIDLINEMKRISKKYVSVFSVNGRNIGFPLHRLAHWITKITWIHGDIRFNNPSFVKMFFKENELKNINLGSVDCPIWPDSLGFRDIRLHKKRIAFKNVNWKVPYVDYLKNNEFPVWLKYVYFIEKLPLPLFIKFIYAHIFYVMGEIDS